MSDAAITGRCLHLGLIPILLSLLLAPLLIIPNPADKSAPAKPAALPTSALSPSAPAPAPGPALDRLAACSHPNSPAQPCPTCGLTRSMAACLRGDLDLARHCHPAGPDVVAFLLLQLILRIPALFHRQLSWHLVDLAQFLVGWTWVACVGWGFASKLPFPS